MSHRLARIAMVVGLMFSGLIAAGPALAQTRLSIGAGAGVVNPLHGDFDFLAPAWLAEVRLPMSDLLLVQFGVTQWRHDETRVVMDVPLQGPGGAIGSIDQLTQRTERVGTGFGAGVLVEGGGRVRVGAGGGTDVFTMRRRFEQTLAGCSAPDAASCRDSMTTSNTVRLGFHAMVDMGVPVGRFTPFVQVRYELWDARDPGASSVGIWAGGRVSR